MVARITTVRQNYVATPTSRRSQPIAQPPLPPPACNRWQASGIQRSTRIHPARYVDRALFMLHPATAGAAGAATTNTAPQPIERVAHAEWTLLQHVRVEHRRAHILVTEQLLHGAEVAAVFEQVRRERTRVRCGGRDAEGAGRRERDRRGAPGKMRVSNQVQSCCSVQRAPARLQVSGQSAADRGSRLARSLRAERHAVDGDRLAAGLAFDHPHHGVHRHVLEDLRQSSLRPQHFEAHDAVGLAEP